ncbi:MAG: TIGR03915 family putative DNA repair protein [Spirochaetaceae bacterium]|nr:TIGR03915 family putative DNA repair protein [Spirochaetaceae bacterium]
MEAESGAARPGCPAPRPRRGDLFGEAEEREGPDSGLDSAAAALADLSAEAHDAFALACMSDPPIAAAALRFARRVIAAASRAGPLSSAEARRAAEQAATDRGDGDVRLVRERAYRVRREIDRMRGFLRFSLAGGIYTARCAPDNFILPALAGHFSARFGESPWAVIDERRALALRGGGAEPRIMALAEFEAPGAAGEEPWEELWRLYHRSVNNEARQNPALQARFIPLRYRRYLTEFKV